MSREMKERVRRMLDENGVKYDWLEHERVFSMEDCLPIGERLGARHCKNLLLSNRQRTRHYLLLTDDRPFKTAAFARALGVSRVSFVPGEEMPELLGAEPGAASPLALIARLPASGRFNCVACHGHDRTAQAVQGRAGS